VEFVLANKGKRKFGAEARNIILPKSMKKGRIPDKIAFTVVVKNYITETLFT
jgi:hypothetical protein